MTLESSKSRNFSEVQILRSEGEFQRGCLHTSQGCTYRRED